MKAFQTFIIKEHTLNKETLIASFSYSFDDNTHFTETIDFSCTGFTPIKNIDFSILDNFLFHLSIALWISYYKLYPTASIKIENWTLDDDQIYFWKQFYINGLGEFFFKNNLKPFAPELISTWTWFLLPWEREVGRDLFPSSTNKALIPMGGWKDSLVSIELIKKTWIPFNTCTFGKDNPLYEEVNKIIKTPRLFIARQMSPLLFEMNKAGYYNGHVPISGIIAFVLTTAAYLYDYKYIVMSNEKSADEGNTQADGMIINHQRSKSSEFEKAFQKYVEKYISWDIKYFSLLRGMYEFKIVQEFAKYPQYFSAFSSCNRNFHILSSTPKVRCNQCPKCAFVYTILRPRITHEQTIQIFGKELYEDESLTQLFKELLGISGIKPFECVGTNEEVILAMEKFYQQSEVNKIFPIIKIFEDEILKHMSEDDFIALEKKLMKIYKEDNIPEEIRNKVFSEE